jgi:hypothetical protein
MQEIQKCSASNVSTAGTQPTNPLMLGMKAETSPNSFVINIFNRIRLARKVCKYLLPVTLRVPPGASLIFIVNGRCSRRLSGYCYQLYQVKPSIPPGAPLILDCTPFHGHFDEIRGNNRTAADYTIV